MACLDSAGVFLRFLVLFSLLVLPGFMIPGCEVLFICVCVVHRVVSGLVLMAHSSRSPALGSEVKM